MNFRNRAKGAWSTSFKCKVAVASRVMSVRRLTTLSSSSSPADMVSALRFLLEVDLEVEVRSLNRPISTRKKDEYAFRRATGRV